MRLDDLKKEFDGCGYAITLDKERDCFILSPNAGVNEHFPEAILLLPEPEEEEAVEILIPIIEYDFKKNLLEVLKFVTLFNWDSVPGKLIYAREDSIFYYHIIFPVDSEKLSASDVCINFMSGALFMGNIEETLRELIAGKYDADEGLESMTELEGCLMENMKNVSMHDDHS